MPIILIAVTDMNDGIGDANGNLLFDLPKDMKRFKSITSKQHVVMGRKTWESLPVKPLPNRRNYVLTMNEDYKAEGATVFHSVEEVHELAKTKDVYIMGGGEIYYQFIDDADELIITHVHTMDMNARVHFPDYNARDWVMEGKAIKHEEDAKHAHSFTFARYKRKQ